MKLHKGWFRVWLVVSGLYLASIILIATANWPELKLPKKPKEPGRVVWSEDYTAYERVSEAVRKYRRDSGLYVENKPGGSVRDPELIAYLNLSSTVDRFEAVGEIPEQIYEQLNSETARLLNKYSSKIPNLSLLKESAFAENDTLLQNINDDKWEYWRDVEYPLYEDKCELAVSEYKSERIGYVLGASFVAFMPPLALLVLVVLTKKTVMWVRRGFREEQSK